MKDNLSERRLVENQVVFRGYNERVQEGFDKLNKVAREQGEEPYILDDRTPLHFYCECSDEDCRVRIPIRRSTYNGLHKARDTFIIICGHEVKDVEDVIMREPEYCVVKKHKQPPKSVSKLNKTPLNNA